MIDGVGGKDTMEILQFEPKKRIGKFLYRKFSIYAFKIPYIRILECTDRSLKTENCLIRNRNISHIHDVHTIYVQYPLLHNIIKYNIIYKS